MTTNMDGVLGSIAAEMSRWEPHYRAALADRMAADEIDAILRDARERLAAIAATAPDPGWTAPHVRAFTTAGIHYVAMYRALSARGYDAARAWEVCGAATRARFAAMGAVEKRMAGDGLFSWPMKALSRWIARRSKAAPVGGYVLDFVEGEADRFDYGVDYHRCAIRELAIANGAAEFAPYVCLSDIHGSDAFGWGLERTETLAQGGARCDFRFRRGGPTKVTSRLPAGNGDV